MVRARAGSAQDKAADVTDMAALGAAVRADRKALVASTLKHYDGGHMFYSRDASRRAFRDDVRRLFDDALAARAATNGN